MGEVDLHVGRKMPRCGVIIEARTGSSRLPGKVLRELWNGKSLLECLAERFSRFFTSEQIIIATTNDPQDECIVQLATDLGVNCFRGSECDVLDRVYRAAESHGLDLIAEITGDNPFADPFLCKRVLSERQRCEMTLCSTDLHWHDHAFELKLPIGLGFKIFDFHALKHVWLTAHEPVDREHVINSMVRSSSIKKINWQGVMIESPESYRLTVDFPEDLTVVRTLAMRCQNNIHADHAEILNILRMDDRLRQSNSHCTQTNYAEKKSARLDGI